MRKALVGFVGLAAASIAVIAIATRGGSRNPSVADNKDPVAIAADVQAEQLDHASETPQSVPEGGVLRKPAGEPQVGVDPIVDISLSPLHVYVREAGSEMPIDGATVICDAGPAVTTNSEGVARLTVDSRKEHYLRATAPGFCPGTGRVGPGPPGAVSERTLTLVSPATVFGIVRGPDGAPAKGAEVQIHFLNLGLIRPISSYVDGLQSGSRTMTDADGAFRFGGIGSSKGRCRAMVVVLDKGCARLEGDAFDVPNGKVVGPLLFDLRVGARVHGSVTPSGSGTATIFIAGADEFVDTDSEGSFVLDHLPSGNITLDATLLDSPWVRTSVDLVLQPGEDRRLDIVLDQEMRDISGFVSTLDGAPLAGVRVWCETSDFYSLESRRYWARTRPNGHYRIEFPVRPGETELSYTLRLERWEDDCAVNADSRQATVDIECVDSRAVKLTAVDAADGQPLSNFKPVWHPNGDASVHIIMLDYEIGPNGQLETIIPSGPGNLRIRPSGYLPRILPVPPQPESLIDLGKVQFDPVK